MKYLRMSRRMILEELGKELVDSYTKEELIEIVEQIYNRDYYTGNNE